MRVLSMVFLLALPGVAAAPQLLITHDVADDGLTYAGNFDRFGFALVDGTPQFHQDVTMVVAWNGQTILATSLPGGHDYDGVGSYGLSFPGPGSYTVSATWGDESATFNGTVLPRPEGVASLTVTAPSTATAGDIVPFSYEILANGTRVNHSDVLVTIHDDDGRSILRTQTHTHEEAQSFQYAFPEAGTYTVRFTAFKAFPTANAFLFPAVGKAVTVDVAAPPAPLIPTPITDLLADPSTPAPQTNRVVEGTTGPNRLIGTYDPYDVVAMGQAMRLSAIVLDPEGKALPHVDFEASILGPDGVVFQSDTLHEYDGVFEFLDRRNRMGDYTLSLSASQGSWTDAIEMTYKVVAPTNVPGQVSLTGSSSTPTDCAAADLAFTARLGDNAYAHSEVSYQVVSNNATTIADGKLHTHGSGTFATTLGALPVGHYDLHADVQATDLDGAGPSGRAANVHLVGTCASGFVEPSATATEESPLGALLVPMGVVIALLRRR